MVNEIFLSLQGEGVRTGLPCVLVRLSGCNLRCEWCDTKYAYEDGFAMEISDILARVAGYGVPRVEVTGGEPLVQSGTTVLLKCLCDAGYETLLETNGAMDISAVDPRVIRIMDIKCPASGESNRNDWNNMGRLRRTDEVKFVLAGREDYDFARAILEENRLASRCRITLSPVAGRLNPAELAEWILKDRLDVRLGLQLHKILWPGKDRGV